MDVDLDIPLAIVFHLLLVTPRQHLVAYSLRLMKAQYNFVIV